MRTTWIILLLMVLAGGAMFYFARRPKRAAALDTIRVADSTDTLSRNVKVFLANNPVEVHYVDTLGWLQDSTPLRKILDHTVSDKFDKRYSTATLFITYNDAYFFDLEVIKPDTTQAYDISFRVQPSAGGYAISGSVDNKKDYLIHFTGPMFHIYSDFLVTYNNKLPPQPVDSSAVSDSSGRLIDSAGNRVPRANKTVTILRK